MSERAIAIAPAAHLAKRRALLREHVLRGRDTILGMLISDPGTLADLRSQWEGVIRMRKRMETLATVTFASGSITRPSAVIYNLPLLLAFDVLRQVLRAACKEGCFPRTRTSSLGHLMCDAKHVLSWIDWNVLHDGVAHRNAVAHDGVLHDKDVCINDIEAIEAQLFAWGVIESVRG